MVTKPISEQLEALNWRTTQREQQRGYEHMDTVDKWAEIIGAIMHFQNTMNGVSPSNQYIAKETGLSGGQVGYHLKRMQERGLIYDDGQWPRHIQIIAAKVQTQPALDLQDNRPKMGKTEVKAVESSQIGGKTRKQRQGFMDNAKRFAEILVDHWDKYGEAPYMTDIAIKMGYGDGGNRRAGTGALSRVANEMVRRGWLHHERKHQRDMVLTGAGRAALFNEVRGELHTDMPVHTTKPNPMATAFPALRPPEMTIRRAEPPIPMRVAEPVPTPPIDYRAKTAPPEQLDLSKVDTVDLLLELQDRGLKVTRG
jgi:hypothetical protein